MTIHRVRLLSEVLAAESTAREQSWATLRREFGPAAEADLVSLVLDDPAQHLWRIVDAALDRSVCPGCGASLGAGERGCDPCDFADGTRFLGQEPDRTGVPPGNEHAIRVALTLLRFPYRWPGQAVAGAEVFLPLFDSGQMPTRAEQLAVVDATRAGRHIDADGVTTFTELAGRASRSGR